MRPYAKTKLFYLIIIPIIAFLLLRNSTYEFNQSTHIGGADAKQVWEFIADFSNMKLLNPTLVDFNIISESGNYNHWQYIVEYREKLSHWPYLPNVSTARYDIRSNVNTKEYLIDSKHITCLFFGRLCLTSTSSLILSNGENGTTAYKEAITYECPKIFFAFCARELEHQRDAVLMNLKRHFDFRKLD